MSVTAAPLVVAILGLGEAGSALARDLMSSDTRAIRKVIVRVWDPAPRGNVADIPFASSAVEAVTGAQVALSSVDATAARDVARAVAPALTPDCIYADLHTSSPALKRAGAAIVEPAGALFTDIAFMAAAPWHGLRTPALAAGAGARPFQAIFAPLGMPVEVVSAQAGDATARKLMRNALMKRRASAFIESLEAQRHLAMQNGRWQSRWSEPAHTEAPAHERLMRRFQRQTMRRVEEMAVDETLLRELTSEPRAASATADGLREMVDSAPRYT